jgi:hypothetical protein
MTDNDKLSPVGACLCALWFAAASWALIFLVFCFGG